MYRNPYRAGSAIVALALAALAACVDEQGPTRPIDEPPMQAAPGDVYIVTNPNDNGVGSLRWALSYVTGGETIRFDASIAGQTITLDSVLDFRKPFTMEGPAGKGITISGGGKTRIMELNHTGVVTMRNLSLTGGNTSQSGGAAQGLGEIVLENVAVYGNRAGGYSALNVGKATLINVTVTGNVALHSPGGPSDPVKYQAIGARNLTLVNSTVAFNTDSGVFSDFLTLRNSVIANNGIGKSCRWADKLTLEGVNIADDDSCGGPTGAIIGDPMLAPLADNGGPNMTHALQVGSPAINAGTDCSVSVDQRYVARDAQCDLGAFEFIDFTGVTLTINATAGVNKSTGWAVVTGTVHCTRDEAFDVAVTLAQMQKKGQQTITAQATGTVSVACGTTARPWSIALVPAGGVFDVGSAQATAQTANQAKWVTPANVTASVRLRP